MVAHGPRILTGLSNSTEEMYSAGEYTDSPLGKERYPVDEHSVSVDDTFMSKSLVTLVRMDVASDSKRASLYEPAPGEEHPLSVLLRQQNVVEEFSEEGVTISLANPEVKSPTTCGYQSRHIAESGIERRMDDAVSPLQSPTQLSRVEMLRSLPSDSTDDGEGYSVALGDTPTSLKKPNMFEARDEEEGVGVTLEEFDMRDPEESGEHPEAERESPSRIRDDTSESALHRDSGSGTQVLKSSGSWLSFRKLRKSKKSDDDSHSSVQSASKKGQKPDKKSKERKSKVPRLLPKLPRPPKRVVSSKSLEKKKSRREKSSEKKSGRRRSIFRKAKNDENVQSLEDRRAHSGSLLSKLSFLKRRDNSLLDRPSESQMLQSVEEESHEPVMVQTTVPTVRNVEHKEVKTPYHATVLQDLCLQTVDTSMSPRGGFFCITNNPDDPLPIVQLQDLTCKASLSGEEETKRVLPTMLSNQDPLDGKKIRLQALGANESVTRRKTLHLIKSPNSPRILSEKIVSQDIGDEKVLYSVDGTKAYVVFSDDESMQAGLKMKSNEPSTWTQIFGQEALKYVNPCDDEPFSQHRLCSIATIIPSFSADLEDDIKEEVRPEFI